MKTPAPVHTDEAWADPGEHVPKEKEFRRQADEKTLSSYAPAHAASLMASMMHTWVANLIQATLVDHSQHV